MPRNQFSSETPAAPFGVGDNVTPQAETVPADPGTYRAWSFYVKRATALIWGTVRPDNTSIQVDPVSGLLEAIGAPPTGTAGGDLSGTYPDPAVAKLQGVSVSTTAPTDGQILEYVSTDGKWEPKTPAAAGDVNGPASSTTHDLASFADTTGKLLEDRFNVDTDGTLAADSDTRVASQKAAKTYADTKVAGAASSTDGDFMQFSGTSGKASKDTGLALDTDGTMAADSDSRVPSQKAVVTYVAAHGSSSGTPVDNEVVTFTGTAGTLAFTPIAGSQHGYRNGQRMTPGVGNDYTISGANITLAIAASGSDAFLFDYRK